MKEQAKENANVQGESTSDRNFNNLKDAKQQAGISNSGGQRSDQTPGRSSIYKPKRRML